MPLWFSEFLFKESLDFFLKTVQFSSGSSELYSNASKRLQVSLMNVCFLFKLGDIQSLWHIPALRSPCRLKVQVDFAEKKPVICPAVCTTHSLCYSDILSVLPSHYHIVNEMFAARVQP